jgi:Holliday junction resolvasome RuvABC endonuclease subunit
MNKTGNPERICAIDASTNSLAFAVYENKNLKEFGKINFQGMDIYQKVGDAAVKTRAYFKDFMKADAIVIEHTVFMNSPKTAADLALVQGALLGAAAMCGITTVGKVSPITWQNYLGNKKLTKEEQILLRVKNPGKSDSWYKTYERQFRKERTIKLIEINYDKTINDNDVADACGIGHWAINNWDKAVGYNE